MTSIVFIICLILAAVMVLIHPALCIPFIIVAYMLAKRGRMDLDSNNSIIIGIVGFIAVLTLIMMIRQWLK